MSRPAHEHAARPQAEPIGASAPAPQPAAEPDAAVRAIMGRIEQALIDTLALRVPKPDRSNLDTSTRLAYERTDLGLQRTAMAAERTLQAWIRTALSMISFGFTIGKLGQAVQEFEGSGAFDRVWSVGGLAYALVVMGTLSLLVASVQYVLAMRELRLKGLPARVSLALGVALALVVLGGFAFSALVMQL